MERKECVSNMKKKIIFVSDIDGTLISDGNELSKTSKRILKELYSKGIQICFATGRDYKKLNDVLGDVEFKYSAICCNGSEIYDEESNVLNKNYLDNEKCERIIQYLEKLDVLYMLYTDKGNVVRGTKDRNTRLLKLGETKQGSFEDIVEEAKIYYKLIYANSREIFNIDSSGLNILKIEIIDSDVYKLTKMKQVLENIHDISITTSFKYNLEIQPLKIDKGSALKDLIDEGYIIIVAGDGENDLSLFKMADCTIVPQKRDTILDQFDNIITRNPEEILRTVEEKAEEYDF